jgi:hypothetical protein
MAKQEVKKEEHKPAPKPEPVKMVKVKILRYVGQHAPGDEVEVTEEIAKHLCAKSPGSQDGHFNHQPKAMLLEDSKKLKNLKLDIRKLSAKDMADLNKKNIVVTPRDPAFEAKVEAIKKGETVNVMPAMSAEIRQPDAKTFIPHVGNQAPAETDEEGIEDVQEASDEKAEK